MSELMKCFVMHGGWKFANLKNGSFAEFANIPIGGSVAIFSQGPVGMMATVGAERMAPLIRLIETNRVDPLALTAHRFPFKDIEKAFPMMQTNEDGMIKPLTTFV